MIKEDDEIIETFKIDDMCLEIETDDIEEDDIEEDDTNEVQELTDEEVIWCIENNIDIEDFLASKFESDEELNKIKSKKSIEKTTAEKIKTSRSYKIFNAQRKTGECDFSKQDNNVNIDEDVQRKTTTFNDVFFENRYDDIIMNSKYKNLLDRDNYEKGNVAIGEFSDIFDFVVSKLHPNYSVMCIFIMTCEYFNLNIERCYKILPYCFREVLVKELREYYPNMDLDNNNENESKLF